MKTTCGFKRHRAVSSRLGVDDDGYFIESLGAHASGFENVFFWNVQTELRGRDEYRSAHDGPGFTSRIENASHRP